MALSLGEPCAPKSFQYHNLLPVVGLGSAAEHKNMQDNENSKDHSHSTSVHDTILCS